jgi:cold shock protein
MPSGLIKFFNEDKGFGFISIDAEYRDVFAHRSQLADGSNSPKKGDKVTFIEGRGRDGRFYARRIVVVKE